LVTVGDAKGLSYYGDTSITQRLSMDQSTLSAARANLIHAGLIAWKKPLYQVLALEEAKGEKPAPRANMGNALSLGEILKMAREGTS
jgi:hypothetical protein